jgi:hypothetical protein
VLNNYFDESRYSLEDLKKFIMRWAMEPKLIRDLLVKMEGWSGQQIKMCLDDLKMPSKQLKLLDAVEDLLGQMTDDSLEVIGTKEIHCEDFISSFLHRGWKVVLVIRNPLDVITSIQYGRGSHYVGKRRPTLFHVRNWRKSAQFAIYYHEKKNFKVVRYEDLVMNPNRELSRLAAFFCVPPAARVVGTAFDSARISWPNNSSFPKEGEEPGFFCQESIGRHKQSMSPEIHNFVHSLCWPEMKFFGYSDRPVPSTYNPATFIEPFTDVVPEFSRKYSAEDKAEQERTRLLAISQGLILSPKNERLFLNNAVFTALLKTSPYTQIK